MSVEISVTGNTIKWLRIDDDTSADIKELRSPAATTLFTLKDNTDVFEIATSSCYLETFTFSEVTTPVAANAQALLNLLNAFVPASGGGGGAPGGADGQVQYNNGGAFGGASQMYWDDNNNRLGVGTSTPNDEVSVVGAFCLDHTATESDDHALEIIVHAAGLGDVKALDIDYVTGAISGGTEEESILVNVDETASLGGNIVGYAMVGTAEGSANKTAVEIGVTIDPILQQAGTFGNMDQGEVNAVDELADLINPAVTTAIFTSDNDTLLIGDIAQFQEIEVLLNTGASGSGIAPTFEYSTGVGIWSTFSPIDGTNAFRNTGVIIWSSSDVSGWAAGTGGNFLIRITRTKNTLSTTPIAQLVQISAITEYSWDKSGDISGRQINAGTDYYRGGNITIHQTGGVDNYFFGLNVGSLANALTEDCIGVGIDVMDGILQAKWNTVMGYQAGQDTEDGNDNSYFGWRAGNITVDNDDNTGIGSGSMSFAGGNRNTFVGRESGNGSDGDDNTGVGDLCLDNFSLSGDQNTGLGAGNVGAGVTTGSGNLFLGFAVGSAAGNVSNQLMIDNSNTATPLLHGDFSANTLEINGGLTVTTTTDAFTPPVMTAAQGAALTATNGMMIYVTSTDATFVSVGFWGYEGGAWTKL